MRSGFAGSDSGASGVNRRVARLLVLLGLGVAAYLVLSLFDHAARADDGSIHLAGATEPVASVKATATTIEKSLSKATASTVRPRKGGSPAINGSRPRSPRVRMTEASHGRKTHVSPKIRTVVTSKVRGAVPVTVKPGRTADLSRKIRTSARLPQPRMFGVPRVELPLSPRLSGVPAVQVPLWPRLTGLTQVALPPEAPGFSALRTSADTPPSTSLGGSASPPQLTSGKPPSSGEIRETTEEAKPSVPGASARTSPAAPAPQPADRSTPAGQARDSGGSSTPTIGTVSSSWWPDVAAGDRLPAIHRPGYGRTTRYAGPPS
jgi:hypothetical protein